MQKRWFLFDLGNVLVKLAYERVLDRICSASTRSRDAVLAAIDGERGYRDMERGAGTFEDFHAVLRDRAGFREPVEKLREYWSDFFDGPVDGIEELLGRVRARYRVGYLSNSNAVHAEVIPVVYPDLFRDGEPFVFSHIAQCSKPDVAIYRKAIETIDAKPEEVLFTDDLQANVDAANAFGMTAYLFRGVPQLEDDLHRDGHL
jgi:glucose-1-phosphatase